MKRYLFLIPFLSCAVLFTHVPQAQANLLEFLFPSLKRQEYDPTKTMKAPFADDPDVRDEGAGDIGEVLKEGIPLNLAHRNEQQIAEWLTGAVSAILTFENEDLKSDLSSKNKFFNSTGSEQFIKFLNQENLLTTLKGRKYVLRTFVNGVPIKINEGAAQGRYRWLFRVPVMISIMDANVADYKKVKEMANKEGTLQIQVGRTDRVGPDNPDGLLVEAWQGTLEASKLQ